MKRLFKFQLAIELLDGSKVNIDKLVEYISNSLTDDQFSIDKLIVSNVIAFEKVFEFDGKTINNIETWNKYYEVILSEVEKHLQRWGSYVYILNILVGNETSNTTRTAKR